MPGDWKRILGWSVLSLLLSAACVAAVLKFLGQGNPIGALVKAGLSTLGISAAIVIAGWIVDGWRLIVLAKAMGGRLSLAQAVHISVMGSFMAGVTPFDTGGEPLKIFFLRRRAGLTTGQATAAVALAAIFHATTKFFLWAVAPFVALLLGVKWQAPAGANSVVMLGLTLYVGSLAIMAASVWRPELVVRATARVFGTPLVKRFAKPGALEKAEAKIRGTAADFREGVLALRSKGAPAVAALALSVLHWLVLLAVPVFLLRSLGAQASWFHVIALSLSVYLVTAYTPTPGGSGGAEIGTVVFFSSVLPARILGTFIVVWRAVSFAFTVLVGGLLVVLETVMWSVRRARMQSE